MLLLCDMPEEILSMIISELEATDQTGEDWHETCQAAPWLGKPLPGQLKDSSINLVLYGFTSALAICNALFWRLTRSASLRVCAQF